MNLRDELLKTIGDSYDAAKKEGKDGDYIDAICKANNDFMLGKVINPLIEEIYAKS